MQCTVTNLKAARGARVKWAGTQQLNELGVRIAALPRPRLLQPGECLQRCGAERENLCVLALCRVDHVLSELRTVLCSLADIHFILISSDECAQISKNSSYIMKLGFESRHFLLDRDIQLDCGVGHWRGFL